MKRRGRPPGEPKHPRTVRLPQDVDDEIARRAEALGVTCAKLVAQLVTAEVRREVDAP